MKKSSLPTALIILLALLIFFAPSYGWKLRGFLAGRSGVAENASSSLALENENLKAELAKLQNIKAQLPERPANFVRALVYVRAPFNFKNEILLNVGRRDGVAAKSAVVFRGILIGKILTVFDDTSLALTVFDSRFQAPVRLGSSGAEALFRGGSSPMVALVPLKAAVQKSDIVYSAGPDLPYGTAIGELGEVKTSADQLFREAPVVFAYDISSVTAVFVRK